jgi:WD40 repeat protein
MRRATIILSLILLAFSFVYINHAVNDEKNMEQKRPNSLGKLYFIPQRDLIVAVCGSVPNGSIRFWSINDGKLMETLDLGKGVWADSMAVSNSGNLVAIALFPKNETMCYTVPEKKLLWNVKWLEKGIVDNAMRFTPDDRKLVAVGFKNIVTYDAETGTLLERQEDSKGFSGGFPRYRTRNNAISPSARYAAFWKGNLEHDEGWWSSKNIWVVVRDIETRKTISKQGKIQEKYKNCSAVFTRDDDNVVLGSMDGHVRVWSIKEQRISREWQAFWDDKPSPFEKNPAPNNINSMLFSREGQYLATMGFDIKSRFAIRIWEYSSNKLIHEFTDVISSSLGMCSGYPMAFSLDGKYFALEQQGQLCLYDTQNWEEKWCVLSWPEDNRMK